MRTSDLWREWCAAPWWPAKLICVVAAAAVAFGILNDLSG